MSKIAQAFKNSKNGKCFIPFITAGDPNADTTVNCILEMVKNGADIVEIGIPFSDPIAEGVVIQEADLRALSGGMTMAGVFDVVVRVRKETDIPICLMTYLNPVFHYGYDAFCKKCKETGVNGLIIPDMPFEEKGEILEAAHANDVEIVSLIAPTSESRIREIAKDAEGFIYVVSSMGVTGVRSEITTDIGAIVKEIKAVSDVPVAIGFGISTPEQAAKMAGLSDGAIVGSAIVKIVAKEGSNAVSPVGAYVKDMAAAVHAL